MNLVIFINKLSSMRVKWMNRSYQKVVFGDKTNAGDLSSIRELKKIKLSFEKMSFFGDEE